MPQTACSCRKTGRTPGPVPFARCNAPGSGVSIKEEQVSEARDLAEAHIRAFNERAWSRAAEIYAPDLVAVEPGGTTRGISDFLGHAQGFTAAFPDSQMEVTTIIESG